MGDVVMAASKPHLIISGDAHTAIEDDRVLSFSQWVQLNGFSPRTGRRVLASGNGPIVTQLSPKRIGVTVANNRAWQAARARVRT
jgi:hypothetical protein